MTIELYYLINGILHYIYIYDATVLRSKIYIIILFQCKTKAKCKEFKITNKMITDVCEATAAAQLEQQQRL